MRQMLAGERPITEKTIAALEALQGMRGWFSATAPSPAHPSPAEPAPPDLAEQLVELVAGLPAARWRSIRSQLDALAGAPEMRDDVLGEVRALLAADPGKQRRAG